MQLHLQHATEMEIGKNAKNAQVLKQLSQHENILILHGQEEASLKIVFHH